MSGVVLRATAQMFWSRFDRNGDCWIWTGAADSNGYGKVGRRENGHQTCWRIHRFAWTLAFGPIPAGLNVLHHCDNRRCGRPSHLFLGTKADNTRDMVRKRRYGALTHPESVLRGERANGAVLTWRAVREIRALADHGGMNRADLARQYGLSWSAVNHVIARRTWKECEPDARTVPA